ncbi:hypothetical protein R1sor_026871 [Riccia sorocarpa]|uniref:Uncharacterized protein n=1 Tax=Riccia sorocarpa TaxID=122646 RepID=A0ABD3GCN9_9MARC
MEIRSDGIGRSPIKDGSHDGGVAIGNMDQGSSSLPIPVAPALPTGNDAPAHRIDVSKSTQKDILMQDGVRMVRVDSWGYRPEGLQEADFPLLNSPVQTSEGTGGSLMKRSGAPGLQTGGDASTSSAPPLNAKDCPGFGGLKPTTRQFRPAERGAPNSRKGKDQLEEVKDKSAKKHSPRGDFTLPRIFKRGKDLTGDPASGTQSNNLFNALRELEENEHAVAPSRGSQVTASEKLAPTEDKLQVPANLPQRLDHLEKWADITDEEMTSKATKNAKGRNPEDPNHTTDRGNVAKRRARKDEAPEYQRVETFSQLLPVEQDGAMEA